MRVPVWLTLGIAALVIVFGLYRIRLSFRKSDEGAGKGRLLGSGMGPRAHLFIGLIYLLLGAALIATTFGFNPLGDAFGPSTETPAKDKAPTKTGVPIDTVPAPKK